MQRTGKKKKTFLGNESSEKALRDIEVRLRRQGASAVKAVAISDVVVDERVRLKCQIPICDSYGKNLMCPPHVPSVAVFRDALAQYDKAILIQMKAALPHSIANGPSADVYDPAKKLHAMVNLAEKWAFDGHFRFATGLIGGCCRLCDECVVVKNGRFCRHPFKARPSMEAMGIDVVKTVINARLSTHFPIVNEVTWTGILLI